MTIRPGEKEKPKEDSRVSSLGELGNGRFISRYREARKKTELTCSHYHE